MEIVKSDTVAYGFTVKKLGKEQAEIEDYCAWFIHISKFKNVVIEHHYPERDSQGKIHYHGVIYVPKTFYRKRLEFKGFHLKLEQIYDLQGWIRYITKDQLKIELFAQDCLENPPEEKFISDDIL